MCKKNLANRFAFALLATALLLPVAGYAASERARQALEDNPALQHAPDSVLVRFAAGTNGNERAEAMRAAHASHARTLMASARLEQLYLIAGRPVEAALNALSRLPFVESAEADFVVRAVTNDQFYGLLYAINNTGQVVASQSGTFDADMDVAEAWSLSIGDPDLVIAVIDDGVEYTHPDINDQMWVNPGEVVDGVDNDGNGYVDDIFGYDFYSNDSDPYDDNNINTGQGGHGTHVAGTICAEGNNSIGIVGVVQQCRIMALRFLGPQGGYTSDAISAVNYAVGKGVRLSNNSWGGGGYSPSLSSAIQSAGNQGHLFVAAAGNGGDDRIGDSTDSTPHYPSSYDLPNIVSVAATDNRDQLASFSNFGVNSVDVAAPGVDIASSAWGSYYYFSGTSMATPNVTGVAALILSQNPGFSYAQVRDRLLQTARPVPGLSGKVATGGVVNALAALSVTPPEPPPAARPADAERGTPSADAPRLRQLRSLVLQIEMRLEIASSASEIVGGATEPLGGGEYKELKKLLTMYANIASSSEDS
ncbi:MAG: S8 family serine peptidase, partial [Gammaproteobacteria bacterium]